MSLPPLDRMRVYDLSRPLEHNTPASGQLPPFRMALIRRHGDQVQPDGRSGSTEMISLTPHVGTHIDALSHISMNGKLHGGVDAVEAARGGRYQVLGIDTVSPIVCRGVLLNLPEVFATDSLEAGRAVTAEDLDAACRHHGVSIAPGDAVILRTGWAGRYYGNNEAYAGRSTGSPGPDVSAADWLAAHGVRVTGSDTIPYERMLPEPRSAELPVHVRLLVDHGIHIIEVMDLEELARDYVREFIFVAAPLKIVGGTGSPLRPLALVG